MPIQWRHLGPKMTGKETVQVVWDCACSPLTALTPTGRAGKGEACSQEEGQGSQVPGPSQSTDLVLHQEWLYLENCIHAPSTQANPLSCSPAPAGTLAVPQILRNSVSVQHGAFLMDSKGGYVLCLQDSWWPHVAVSNTLLRKLTAVSTPTA